MFYTIRDIQPICHDLHAAGQRIVLSTGFFDLLHSEHINFLKAARAEGDILIVAVESDLRARKLKGGGRPIETQVVRARNLLSLTDKTETLKNRHADTPKSTKVVDFAILLPDDFDQPTHHESLISAVKPDIFAISEHTFHQDEKQSLVVKHGGELKIVHPHNPAVSTTQLLSQK